MLPLEDEDDEELNAALPETFRDVRARIPESGEARLWWAVFHAAVIALDRGAEDAVDVWLWVSSDAEELGDYATICDILGLPKLTWRRALLQLPRRPRGRPTVKRCAECQRKRWACPHGPIRVEVAPVEAVQVSA
jgi:hypothetical protein